MPKPDPALLEPARYPFSCLIDPRFSDLDVNQHINNVALMGIIEESRVRFHTAARYHDVHGDISSMVASFSVEFLGQGFYPEALEGHAGFARLGRTSHVVDQLITQKGRLVAFAQSIIVSTLDGRPVDIPPRFRESAQPWMLRL